MTESIQLGGGRPSPVAVGEGFVWVGMLDDRALAKIDPVTRTVLETIGLVPYTPTGVATSPGAVWIAHGYARLVLSLRSQCRLRRRDDRRCVKSVDRRLGGVRFRGGLVCLRGRRDRQGQPVDEPVHRHRNRGKPPLVRHSRCGLRLGSERRGQLRYQINPRTVSEVDDFSVGGSPRSIAFGAGAVWVANEATDNVTRIDTSSGFTTNIPVGPGSGPTGIAYGAGAVWVANAGAGTVSRIDPTTEEVVEVIPVGNRPTGIAFGEGAVWVTVQAPIEE